MKSRIYSIFLGVVICIVSVFSLCTVNNVNVYAVSGSISLTGADGSVGDTITVTLNIQTEALANAQVYISYDTNFLEYTGATSPSDVTGGTGGTISAVINGIPNNYSVGLYFKLKKEGQADISIAQNSTLKVAENSELMDCAMSGTKVNIAATRAASNDSTLSGLLVQAVTSNGDNANITYTPNFSPEIHEYTCELGVNVTRLVIATTLSDSKSKTSVSGTKINAGSNMTTITVTAEDGSSTVYTLYSTRLTEETTEPVTVEGETTAAVPTDFDRAPKFVDSINMYIIQDFTLTTIPEGYEEGVATFRGEPIAVLKGKAKPLTLVCLSEDVQGTNIRKYLLNETSGAIDALVDLTSMQRMYTIIPTSDSYTGPEGYVQTTLEVNGQRCKAWIKEEGSEYYVVNAMNWNGETSLYVYDAHEQTMQRFVQGNKSENISDEPVPQSEEYLLLKKEHRELKDKYTKDCAKKDKKIKFITVVAAVIIIVLLTIIFLLFRENKNENGKYDNDDNDDDINIDSDDAESSENETENSENIAGENVNSYDNKEETDEISVIESENVSVEENTLDNYSDESANASEENESRELDKINRENVITDNERIKADKEEEILLEEAIVEETEKQASGILDALSTQNLQDVIEEVKRVEISEEKNTKENLSNSDEVVVNLEEDEPFEIEFVDV